MATKTQIKKLEAAVVDAMETGTQAEVEAAEKALAEARGAA